MPALELRNTTIRIQAQGSGDIALLRTAEAAIQQRTTRGVSIRDPFRGIIKQRQTAWFWQIQTLAEMKNESARTLFLRKLLNEELDADTEPPSFTLEATTPEGKHRRLHDARVNGLTITIEKRRIVGMETRLVALKATAEATPLASTLPQNDPPSIVGADVTVQLDDVAVDAHRLSLTFERPNYQPTNYQTDGTPSAFTGTGQWDIAVLLDLAGGEDDMPVNLPEGRKKLKVTFGTLGSITIPVVYFLKPKQQLTSDDFDDRAWIGRAEAEVGQPLATTTIGVK